MKLRNNLVTLLLLLPVVMSYSISLDSLYRFSKLDPEFQVDRFDTTNGNSPNTSPLMRQLLLLFGNSTNMTAQELASDVLIQNFSIIAAILKFWKKIVKSVVETTNPDLFGALNDIPARDFLNKICCKAPQEKNPATPNLRPSNHKTPSSARQGTNVDEELQQCSDVKSELLSTVYGPEMSYITLQKWIEDYGLSASSLRDYLETYLFAGDHLWVAKLAAQGYDKVLDDDVKFDLGKRLAILGANIDSALTILNSNKVLNQEKDGTSILQLLTNFDEADAKFQDQPVSEQRERGVEGRSLFQKREVETQENLLNDYSPLVHSFLRLDVDAYDVHIQDSQGHVWDDWESEDESLHDLLSLDFECFISDLVEVTNMKANTTGQEVESVKGERFSQMGTETMSNAMTTGENEKNPLSQVNALVSALSEDHELKKMQPKHRIFDNDEIVVPRMELPATAAPFGKYGRSHKYRQVIYADDSIRILTKRDEECVPVTWYNVFHHSVFGKHKFCQV